MEERDFYWESIFEQQRKWTDYELKKRDFVDDDYCSYLVVPQRRRKRLQRAVEAARQRLFDATYNPDVNGEASAFKADLALQCLQQTCLASVGGDWDEFQSELSCSGTGSSLFRSLARLLTASSGSLLSASREDKEVLEETVPLQADENSKVSNQSGSDAGVVEGAAELGSAENKIDQVSFRPFELTDVPPAELRRRLNKGEIAPRDEWLPTQDTTNKKSVSVAEGRERLGFAERLRSEASKRLEAKNAEEAVTLYIQGCHLLEYYRCDVDVTLDEMIQTELRRFRLNAARLSLKLHRFREAITFVEDQLKDSPHDGNALYLRGRGYELAGDFDLARLNYAALRQDAYASDDDRKCGLFALHRLHSKHTLNSQKLKNIVELYQKDLPPLSAEEEVKWKLATSLSQFDKDDDGQASTAADEPISPKPSRSTYSFRSSRPVLTDHTKMVKLLETMLKLYTSPAVNANLEAIRFKADFDERKTILALRKFLPTVLAPVLVKFGYGTESDDYTELKRKFDQDVLYHRHAPDASDCERLKIGDMMKHLHEVLVGSPLD
eukprot:Gregarina_sp_Pseudo_9__270@NODE_1172_length_1814_cov_32_596620_g1098_i0_p1_GENE_NODE_1172_length_1814_cov_32_596620_g1098_i0NODE_1172_length_1814_cov_32_596620_g1098_i0_p1_ORF_typecomplete_len553_score142_69TPR_21/PF09976_9/0_00063TPR_16/PF13432_6/1_6e02TPR_16/PF13432_6/1_6e04TPR_16/PF13432_6/0_00074TPR_19/PF14559_6/3_3e03TPR_19/PF14559_6/1_5e04TPR_19/PF14559_6/0_0021ANAPC3/PF12895_7/0_11TPR_15/PF13429_6/2_9e03TPR_15/PF13429_6/0_21TPR_14/PF13428_6/3_1e03TPR_14/PF13428_6/2_4e02TPR_14/PF13428_6/1_